MRSDGPNLELAGVEPTCIVLKKKFSKAKILILDEFGYVPYDRNGAQQFFDYLSEVEDQKEIIISTILEFSR